MERRIRFELLFRRYEPAVRAYAIRRAGDSLADDVVAEVFVVCWRRFDEVPADPLPWLLGVARNVLATLRRAEQRRGALRSRMLETDAPSPDTGLALSDGTLRAALARLRDDDRELLLLVAWEELTTAEVALVLGVRPSAARVRLMRARRRLRVELARTDAADRSRMSTTMEAS